MIVADSTGKPPTSSKKFLTNQEKIDLMYSHLPEYEKRIKHVYRNEIICGGTGVSHKASPYHAYHQLKKRILREHIINDNKRNNISTPVQPCTIIRGDLEIQNLPQIIVNPTTHQNETIDLSFLNNIRAIYGYLKISRNKHLQKIEFLNLEIVQSLKYDNNCKIQFDRKTEIYQTGKNVKKFKDYPGASIMITQNPSLTTINFPKLRLVKDFGVIITRNEQLCPPNINWVSYGVTRKNGGYINCEVYTSSQELALKDNLNWWTFQYCKMVANYNNQTSTDIFVGSEELLLDEARERVNCQDNNSINCDHCNTQRRTLTDGQEYDQNEGKCYNNYTCQITSNYRSICGGFASDYHEHKNKYRCCPAGCSAGCYFDDLEDRFICYACDVTNGYKIFLNSTKGRPISDKTSKNSLTCINDCNKLNQKLNILTQEIEVISNITYYTYKDHCVDSCPTNMKVENRNCVAVKRTDNIPEHCWTHNYGIYASNITRFKGCTKIKGDVILQHSSLKGQTHTEYVNGSARLVYTERPILKSDLQNFHDVKYITGKLRLDTFAWVLGSYSIGDMLPNLQYIQATETTLNAVNKDSKGMFIFICSYKVHLGLSNLIEVKGGGIDVGPGSCNIFANDSSVLDAYASRSSEFKTGAFNLAHPKFKNIDMTTAKGQQAYQQKLMLNRLCHQISDSYNKEIDRYLKFLNATILELKEQVETQEFQVVANVSEIPPTQSPKIFSNIYHPNLVKPVYVSKILASNNTDSKTQLIYQQIENLEDQFREIKLYYNNITDNEILDNMNSNLADCEPCHEHCKSCWLPNHHQQCIECQHYFSIKKDYCVKTCDASEFPTKMNKTMIANHSKLYYRGHNICQTCNSNCNNCNGTSNHINNCLECKGGWFFDNSIVKLLANENKGLEAGLNLFYKELLELQRDLSFVDHQPMIYSTAASLIEPSNNYDFSTKSDIDIYGKAFS